MKHTTFLIVVVVLLLLVTGTAVAQERIAIGDSVEGTLAVGERADYLFEAAEGQALIISLQGDFDTYLYLLDADGNELTRDDDGGEGTNSRLLGWIAPESGSYIAQAASFADAEAGDLTLSVNTFDFIELTIGESVTAEFEEGVDTLYFAFEGTTGEIVDISVDSGNLLDSKLALLHPDNFIYSENLDAIGTVDPGLAAVPLDNGQYYIILSKQNENATLVGEVTVTVDAAELTPLDDGPVDLAFDFDVNESLLAFEGIAGEDVQIEIRVDAQSEFASPRFEFSQGGTQFATFSTRGANAMTAELTVPGNGEVQVRVTAYNEVTVNVMLSRPVN